ncbi:MAG TPA: S1 RNA-binding domain-containing protein [Desulfobulbaceae bacterium]|nr:S1 RNA-binding domain-containing protein [Desulfobulbaceae bacterium]
MHGPIARKKIPFDQRFQRGTIETLEPDICRIRLDGCKWARYARVRQDRLPDGKSSFADYKQGDKVDVFLLDPVKGFPDSMHGSMAWADREKNPWLDSPPKPGQLIRATAILYLEPVGVFVRLKNGIEALLRVNEVPGGQGDITRVVDLGDELAVQITQVRKEVLEVDVSVKEAVKTLRRQEQARRKQDFSREMVERVPLQNQPFTGIKSIRPAILGPDPFFNRDLQRWLAGFGITCRAVQTGKHLLDYLEAHNHPTHVLLDTAIWKNPSRIEMLQERLSKRNIRLIWLKNSPETASPFQAPSLILPLNVGYLVDWLIKDKEPPSGRNHKRPFSFNEYQQRHVQNLADRLLKDICQNLDLQGALWCRMERKGVYVPRSFHGLKEETVKRVQIQLGQSVIASSIETKTVIFREVHRAGPLRQVAPDNSDMLCCLPLAYIPLNGDQEDTRAVAFFYRREDYPDTDKIQDRLQAYVPAMQALVATLHFAVYNEILSTFANLGVNSAAYMHELGQAAQPIKNFLDTMGRENRNPNPREWKTLRRELKKLLNLAKSDLSIIRKQQGSRISVADRLGNIARLFAYRAAPIGCAFQVTMPDHDMQTNIPGLLFDQIINNLLDNAYHFVAGMPANTGRIEIRVFFDADNRSCPLVLEIMDNGPGIRAGMKDKIFKVRDTEKEIGTGMGLFIVRSFLKALGGKIDLQRSIRWQETVFRISLPILLDRYIG